MKRNIVFIIFLSFVYISGCSKKAEDNATSEHQHSSEEEMHNHESEHDHSREHPDESEHQDEDHTPDDVEHSHSHEENEEHEHDAEEHDHTHDYHVEAIQPAPFHEIVRTSGEIKTLPSNSSTIVAPSEGIVHFLDNSMLSGRKVAKNQVFCILSGEQLADNDLYVKYQKSKAEYEQKKDDFERAQNLYEDKLISEKEFLNAKTAYLNAKSDYESREKHFSGGTVSIKAPRSGYIRDVFASEGEYVSAGQKIASVINRDKLLLHANVSQAYSHRIDDFVAANFVTSNDKLYSTNNLNGKVLTVGKSYQENSYYLPVHFEIDAHQELVPGSYVTVFLIGRERQNVIALPKEAFIEEQGNFFVFLKEGEEFVKTPVEKGPTDGKRTEVLEGLKQGDSVVTHGVYHIKLQQASSSLPEHSHNH